MERITGRKFSPDIRYPIKYFAGYLVSGQILYLVTDLPAYLVLVERPGWITGANFNIADYLWIACLNNVFL